MPPSPPPSGPPTRPAALAPDELAACASPPHPRILVCVGASPGSARLIQEAARAAEGLGATWTAVHVDAAAEAPLADAAKARLDAHLRLAESLGAAVVRLGGARVARAILEYARRNGVTRIMIGRPRRPSLRQRLFGSLAEAVVRGSGAIDVHVVTGDMGRATSGARGAPSRPLGAYLRATLPVGAATGIAALIERVYPVPDLEVLYVLAVMLAAIRYGRGPSILAAALSVAAYDYFFVPPFHTFAVADVRYVLTFAVMFSVGLVVSTLASWLRREEQAAIHREARTAALYALSRDLGATLDPHEAAAVVSRHAADVFGVGAAVLLPGEDGRLVRAAAWPPALAGGPSEAQVAAWVHEHRARAGAGTDTLADARLLGAPLCHGEVGLGVLALYPGAGATIDAGERAFLEAFCRQASFAFERVRLAEEARAAALRAKTEELRSTLLSAVSHDLRTPLATITGAATTIRDDRVPPEARAELLAAICDEAERLERLVRNLLDMTRLASGGVEPRREWVPIEELIGAALTRLEGVLAGRAITTEIADGLPLVSVDPILIGQALQNLLENAAKYTPAGSPIDVVARASEGSVLVEIRDRGPGLPEGAAERVFERFHRGAHVGVGGVGLGLPICRGIAEAHGGSVRASPRGGGGAVFELALPIAADAPTTDGEVLARRLALAGEEGA